MCQNLCTYGPTGADRSIGAVIGMGMSKERYPVAGVENVERKCLTVTVYAKNAESPCGNCYMAEDPLSCNDTDCRLWQRWFASQWNAARNNVRQQYQQRPLEEVGVVVGGVRYAPPHRRREFLSVDPCSRCRCPWKLCQRDCRLRQLWLTGKQEALQ